MKKTFLVFVCLLLLSACGGMRYIYTGELNPTPNIDIEPIKERIFLEFDESIKDTFWEYHSDLKPLEVSSWLASLQNGFNNAFKEFNIVHSKNQAQLILKMYDANPTRTILTVSQSDVKFLNTVLVGCQITYKVRLLNARGEILKRASGTANAKRSGTLKYENDQIMASAIESMYETIAKDFFQEVPKKNDRFEVD
jgi:hypothetical protein